MVSAIDAEQASTSDTVEALYAKGSSCKYSECFFGLLSLHTHKNKTKRNRLLSVLLITSCLVQKEFGPLDSDRETTPRTHIKKLCV